MVHWDGGHCYLMYGQWNSVEHCCIVDADVYKAQAKTATDIHKGFSPIMLQYTNLPRKFFSHSMGNYFAPIRFWFPIHPIAPKIRWCLKHSLSHQRLPRFTLQGDSGERHLSCHAKHAIGFDRVVSALSESHRKPFGWRGVLMLANGCKWY